MNLLEICCILSLWLLVTSEAAKNEKKKLDQPQGRTLGLLTPLLLGGGGSLFDVPVAIPGGIPVAGGGGGGGGAASGSQSDPLDQYNQGNYYNYRPNYNYGYRPNYNYGYGYPSYNFGYPNYYRPAYNYYGGYQRPYIYPNNYYGYRPNYSNYNNYNYGGGGLGGGAGAAAGQGAGAGGLGAGGAYPSYSSSPAATSPGAIAGSQLTQAQTAQLAGLLGQALGSSLRPLLANGGAGAGAGAGGAAGANPQALSGLLGLLSG